MVSSPISFGEDTGNLFNFGDNMINISGSTHAIKAKPVVTANEIWDSNAYTTSVTTGVLSGTSKSVFLTMSDHSVLFCPGRLVSGFNDTGKIEIHKTYTFNMINSGLIRAVDLMGDMASAVSADVDSDLRIIHNCLVNKLSVMPDLNRISFTICREINVSGLNEKVNKLYVADIGVLVSCKFDSSDCFHPDSHQYRRKFGEVIKQEKIINNSSSCNIIVDYIDNEGNTGERFVNVFGRIIPIQPIKDPTRSNGLYMSGYALDENKRKINLADYQGDFSKIDGEFDLHQSREAAKNSVDAIAQQEQIDLKRVAHDMEVQYRSALNSIEVNHRAELARMKEENERNLADVKRRIEKDNAELRQGTDASNAALQEAILEESNRQKLKAQKQADKIKLKAQKKADKIKLKAQKEADENKIKAQKELDDQKLKAQQETDAGKLSQAQLSAALNTGETYFDLVMKQTRTKMELDKARQENELSLTQQVAKTIPAVATGVVGTIVAIKLFENTRSGITGMSNLSRW